MPVPTGRPAMVALAAQYQRPELIDHSILMARIIVGKVLLQSSEEFPLPSLLAFESEAD